MTYRLERLTSTLSIASIHETQMAGKFDLNPPYQRKSVWDDDRQSFFIDSLLRNYPIPPIFLKRIIDDATGNTRFEVVDGKQRLTSVFRFIGNEIAASNEDEEANDPLAPFVGRYFKELDKPDLIGFKKNFWRYAVPVEYIDDIGDAELNKVFDRLNRNGVPLSSQELRNAKFYASTYVAFLKEMSQIPFWANTLATIAEKDRSEDTELLADLSFVLLGFDVKQVEGQRFDVLFGAWANALANDADLLVKLRSTFLDITEMFANLELDLAALRIRGTSHIYGIWSLLFTLKVGRVQLPLLSSKLTEFFQLERSADSQNPFVKSYFAGTAARTRSRSSRMKRLTALCGYLGVPDSKLPPFIELQLGILTD